MASHDFSKMSSEELKGRLKEFLADGVRLGAKVHAGTDPKAPQLSRAVRRNIARVRTLLAERERTAQ